MIPSLSSHEHDMYPFKVTCNGILGHALTLAQPAQGARVTMDSLLLAAAIRTKNNDRILEVGTGTGAVALALVWRMRKTIHVTAIERQCSLVKLARMNARLNHMKEHCVIHHADIRTPPPCLASQSFDHIITNPPWRNPHHGSISPDEQRALSFHASIPLVQWVRHCLTFMTKKSRLTLICGQAQGEELIEVFSQENLNIEKMALYSFAHAKIPSRFILSFYPCASPSIQEHEPLILHDGQGAYSKRAHDILHDGKALAWNSSRH